MSINPVRSRRCLAAVAVAAAVVSTPLLTSPASAAPALPPVHANFDYQIGGPYTPPSGVTVVTRDHSVSPAAGLYNICYVNAFQTQPGAEGQWKSDLLLRDGNGGVVYDGKWKEAVLDITTDQKRKDIAAKVNGWVDTCASKGYKAVEFDNLDTFTRFEDYLDESDAKAMITLLAKHAHDKGLAAAQKNTLELAPQHASLGLDFAVVEECGANKECRDFAAAFGNNMILIEYTASGMSTACSGYKDKVSIVRRDEDVVPKGTSGYVRQTC